MKFFGIFSASVFKRLLVSYLITVLLGLGVSGFIMNFYTKDFIYETKREDLLRKAKQVNITLQDDQKISNKDLEQLVYLDRAFETRIWVFNKQGEIIATSMKDEVFNGKSVHKTIVDKVNKGMDVVQELQFEGLDKPMLSVVVPWGMQDNIYGGIVLHAPVEGINQTMASMREAILWATLLGVLLSSIMISYLSWTISRPLRKIDRAAAEIGLGNYEKRVDIQSSDELGELANTINTMAAKLESAEWDRKRMEQVRNDFLANISHELRTPLTAMQGFLEALQDGLVEDEESRQRYYQVMYQETMHLNRLVDDLMDLIKLENNEITLSRYPVDAVEVIQKVAFMFHQEAAEKNVEIKVLAKPDLPKIYGDKDRILQIMQNLVKNAVKFTDQGEIILSALTDGDYVLVKVQDTGIGIAGDDLQRIWERFFKVDRGRSKKDNGTGLGLAIVKELVELHQGRVEVESEPGKGSVFTIRFPAVAYMSRPESA